MSDLESLVGRIYDAAVEPDLWPKIMHDLGQSVGGAGGIILTRRSTSWLGWRYSAGLAQGAEAYLSGPAASSRSTTSLLALKRAGFVTEQEVLSDEEYLADPMMTEWGTPAGLHHSAVTAITAPSGDVVVVQINRRSGQPQFSSNDIEHLDKFRPHLARAGLLAARWRLQRFRAAAEALAIIGLPAAILDERGKVLAANALIEAHTSHVKWLPGDRIGFCDAKADAMLKRAIVDIATPAARSVRSFPAQGTSGKPVVVHLIPAGGRARELYEGGFGVLVVTAIGVPSPLDASLLAGLFDLTAAEARVARGVASGLSLEQIASRQAVSTATVRTQIKAVFAKTGARRQSQLASLLIGQPSIPFGPLLDEK